MKTANCSCQLRIPSREECRFDSYRPPGDLQHGPKVQPQGWRNTF